MRVAESRSDSAGSSPPSEFQFFHENVASAFAEKRLNFSSRSGQNKPAFIGHVFCPRRVFGEGCFDVRRLGDAHAQLVLIDCNPEHVVHRDGVWPRGLGRTAITESLSAKFE